MAQRGHSSNETALQGVRPIAPGHDAVRGARQEACTDDQREPITLRLEAAKHIRPGIVAAYGGAQSSSAIAEAADALHGDAGLAGGGDCGGICQGRTRPRPIDGVGRSAAGDAHRNRGVAGCSALAHPHGSVSARGCGTGANRRLPTLTQSRETRPSPRHPARHATKWTTGLLARGSVHLAAFPSRRTATVISGVKASARRLQLRGQPWVGIGAQRRPMRTTFPHCSLARERSSSRIVERCGSGLSMAAAGGH